VDFFLKTLKLEKDTLKDLKIKQMKKKIIRWVPTTITITCLSVAIGFSSCCDEYNQQKYSIHDAILPSYH
jgi:hypothetical protein